MKRLTNKEVEEIANGGPPLCEYCSKKLRLKKDGTLRKGKRFCSTACQQKAIRAARVGARADLISIMNALENVLDGIYDSRVACLSRRLRRALEILGMIKVQR